MSTKRHVSARRDGVESFKTGLCMHTLLSSERAASGVLDTWVNRGHPLGIFTVLAEHATGEGWLESRAITRVLRGWPMMDQVTGEPADRIRKALDQGHRRRKGRAQRSRFRSGFRPRGVPVLMGERDIGGPAAWTSTRSRCIRSPGMPKTATAKAVGVAFTASVAPSGRCRPMPSAWGPSPSRKHQWPCWSTPQDPPSSLPPALVGPTITGIGCAPVRQPGPADRYAPGRRGAVWRRPSDRAVGIQPDEQLVRFRNRWGTQSGLG